MPVYEYKCQQCDKTEEAIKAVKQRDDDTPFCRDCRKHMLRVQGAPRFRFAGVPTKGGGPDKFTADMLRVPLKDLPEGLKQDGFK